MFTGEFDPEASQKEEQNQESDDEQMELEKLAELIVEKLRFELSIENERFGKA
ncbi:MAG: hypothetical protein JEZ06_04590 [Anaerolineaceae bacterium]|nr:hypothetical protein [Anaerolineaceae bacterium]